MISDDVYPVHVVEDLEDFVKVWPLVEIDLPAIEHQLVEVVGGVRGLRQPQPPHHPRGQLLRAPHLRVRSAAFNERARSAAAMSQLRVYRDDALKGGP